MTLFPNRDTMLTAILFIAIWVSVSIAITIILPIGFFGFATDPPTKICFPMPLNAVPSCKQEEDEFISKFKSLNYSSKCEIFHLAYKQTEPWHESSDGSSIWTSLSIGLNVSQPSPDRDCLEFPYQPTQKVEVKPCEEMERNCYFCLHNLKFSERCRQVSTSCADDFVVSAPGQKIGQKIDTIENFGIWYNLNGNAIGIAVIDDNYYSNALSKDAPSQNSSVALPVKYRFHSSIPNGTIFPYESDSFAEDDAKADCLAVKIKNEATINEESCDEIVRVVCAFTKNNS